MKHPQPESTNAKWYHGVSRYQWLILTIACAGWVFDVCEGQIFNLTRNQLLADVLQGAGGDAAITRYGEIFLGIFLLGGMAGERVSVNGIAILFPELRLIRVRLCSLVVSGEKLSQVFDAQLARHAASSA